ncbi:MAG: riboflavin synthase, partial [Candidatus Omnitrophica bacterium]|nr:riboflavin synthase [Candidatus Omnitrophota bacterium]
IDFQTKVVDLSLKNKTGIIKIFIPAKYRNYFLTKGSIGIDGISLTIAEVQEEYITIWIIPYTLKNSFYILPV